MSKVLVIVAHPDDEALGAGGTLVRHSAAGDEVHIVFLTDGVGARGDDREAKVRRAEAARRAARALGAQEPVSLAFPDNRLDEIGLLDVVQAIETVMFKINPATIYTHHSGDLNVDHAICHRAVLTAARPLPGSKLQRIYAMEIASSTEWGAPAATNHFIPTRYVDISATMTAKREALQAYAEEMRPFPHPRSIEAITALAAWRGASVGIRAAEAFMVVREIEA